MDTIIVVLKVGLLLYAIYSVIVYMSRRSDNRSALKDIRTAPVLRRITDEEKSALQPFLMGQGLTVDDDVRELTGVFMRHGLHAQGGSTEHNTIDDVEVLLPYDAMNYIEAHNQAQVVLSKKGAVVIRLNDFDLLEGRQRAQRQQAQDAQWKRGDVGALPTLEEATPGVPGAALAAGEAATPASEPAGPFDRYRRGEVDVLGQRTETPEEVASRMGRGGWASAFAWVCAFALLWIATWDATRGAQAYLAGAGLLVGLWAAWLFVRTPATEPPQPVNRVRGMLNQIAVVNASNASIQNVSLFIGDKLSLTLPAHWRKAEAVPYGEVIEAELRTSDYSAVGFGSKWSVADEWRRFRPVFWGRHLLHLIVGVLALGAVALSAPDPRGEAALAAQWVMGGGETAVYTDAAQLADKLPAWGRTVRVAGEGRCEIDMNARSQGNDVVPVVDCTRVRWNGSAPVVPAIDVPPSVLALAGPGFIRATENYAAASLIAMMRMQMGQAADPLAVYRARENVPMIVRGFDRSVAMVDAACKDDGGLSPQACENLQRELVRAIDATVEKDGVETPVSTWQMLAASAASDQANASLMVSRRQLAEVQRAVQQAVDSVVAAKIGIARAAIVPASGGVVLASPLRIDEARSRPAEGGEGDRAPPHSDDGADSSLLGSWARLQQHATADGLKRFSLEGLVTASGKDAAGTPQVRIDPTLDASRMATAGAYTLWWLLAAALVLANGLLFALRLVQARRRNARLDADIATRPVPGATGLF